MCFLDKNINKIILPALNINEFKLILDSDTPIHILNRNIQTKSLKIS